MRKINYISIALFLMLMSCDSFLDEIPVSELSVKSYFETSQQFEEAVTGAYTNLRPLYANGGSGGIGEFSGSAWSFAEIRSDNTTCQHNRVDQSSHDWWNMDQFLMRSSNRILQPAWDNCYSAIGKCNTVLRYIEEVDVENKERYVGEALFLRAFYHFYLVRYFENVPLVTTVAKTLEEAFELNKQAPKGEVYKQIISDLNEAKGKLPKSYSASDKGRATEGAARTLLAKALMWQGEYGQAANELEAVINSNQYSLLNDYESVFDINNENSSEHVFSVQYIVGPFGLANNLMYQFLPSNSDRIYLPLQQETSRTGLNIPTEDLINSFEEGDERKLMIDFSFTDPLSGVYEGSIVPFTKKFMDPGHEQRLMCGNNFPVFRYPHVLLMLAECYLREGNGDPLPLINQVRQRAGLDNLTYVTLEDIIHERRVEFHCEADRWDVLVRCGIAKEVMLAHGETQQGLPNISAKAHKDIKLYFPIPAYYIELDPTIQQNPEYK